MTAPITFGLERAVQEPPAILRDADFGLLANLASVDATFTSSHEVLAARFPGRLRALFGPQHGFLVEQQDNMVETPHGREPRLGVPVFSLYAQARKPTPAMLEGLDLEIRSTRLSEEGAHRRLVIALSGRERSLNAAVESLVRSPRIHSVTLS